MNEVKLIDVCKNLELLLKEKFNGEVNSVAQYLEKMNCQKDTDCITDWSDTVNLLTSLLNNASEISVEDVENFMSLVVKDEDPLKKCLIAKGLDKILSEVEREN